MLNWDNTSFVVCVCDTLRITSHVHTMVRQQSELDVDMAGHRHYEHMIYTFLILDSTIEEDPWSKLWW